MTTYTASSMDAGTVGPSIVPLPYASGVGWFGGAQDPGGDAGDGLLLVNFIAGAREVIVTHRRTGVIVGRTWSAADGTWRVGGLSGAEKYDVKARDYTGLYKDTQIDDVSPYVP